MKPRNNSMSASKHIFMRMSTLSWPDKMFRTKFPERKIVGLHFDGLKRCYLQRRQSGSKSGGRGSGSKKFRSFQATFRKISVSSGNLTNKFDFPGTFP